MFEAQEKEAKAAFDDVLVRVDPKEDVRGLRSAAARHRLVWL